jgi:hypothetical protein
MPFVDWKGGCCSLGQEKKVENLSYFLGFPDLQQTSDTWKEEGISSVESILQVVPAKASLTVIKSRIYGFIFHTSWRIQ